MIYYVCGIIPNYLYNKELTCLACSVQLSQTKQFSVLRAEFFIDISFRN